VAAQPPHEKERDGRWGREEEKEQEKNKELEKKHSVVHNFTLC